MRRFAFLSLLAPSALLVLAPVGCDGDDATGGGGGDTTTSTTSGDGGTAGSGGAAPANPVICDPIADDCVEPGTRCAVSFADGRQLPPRCIPALGEDQEGELCERPYGDAGTDTCAPGLYCGFWNQPAGDPQTRECHAFCSEDSPCPPGERCLHMSGGPYGSCLPECDPFNDTCGEGTTCSFLNDGLGSGLATCHFEGTGQVGDTCDFDAVDDVACSAGTTCLTSADGELCRALCDENNPCAGDSACSLFPGTEPVGWCTDYDLSCVGNVTWPTASVTSVELQLQVVEPYSNNIPVAGASVKVCGRLDLDCTTPLVEGMTDTIGELTLTIPVGPGGFDGYFEVNAGSPILMHVARPLVADAQGTLYGAAMPWLARAQATESPLDPTRGHVFMALTSCSGAFGSGATVVVDSADASSSTQYGAPDGMRADRTYTDFTGYGLALDVPPGMTTLTAQMAEGGPVLGTTDIPVRAGAVTLVVMEPTP